MSDKQLTLIANVGSSSLKFTAYLAEEVVFEVSTESHQRCRGDQEYTIIDSSGSLTTSTIPQGSSEDTTIPNWIVNQLHSRFPDTHISAVGHRIVHGGSVFSAPIIITPEILLALEDLIPLCPNHQQRALSVVRSLRKLLPESPHIACFDTSFHTSLPLYERMLALPASYFKQGIRRYGFHGLSYESIALQLGQTSDRALTGRTVLCHLGSGSSVCGLLEGISVATTMSFTPLDGLMMATRTGTIDPGVILFLLRTECMTIEQLEHLLTRESGLLGVSGISGDVRDLLASSADSAKEALGLYCYRVAREIGGIVSALQGIDTLVFTGGIGENSPDIREGICTQLEWLGVLLDTTVNKTRGPLLHHRNSQVRILKLPSNENAIIFKHTLSLLETTLEGSEVT